MLSCAEGLAPVRFDGWDANGDPVGRPITAPLVRCFATEENQAGNTYDNVTYMLQNGSAYDEYPELDVGLTRTFLPDGGEILALTSAPSSKDGGKDTFNVFDETHLWILEYLKNLHRTVNRNIMKRKISDGWSLETSTMYCPGEGSVAEETHKSAAVNPGILFDHRQAPEVRDFDDDDELLAALEYVYGPAAEWMDLEAIVRDQFRDPQVRLSDSKRYWLNQPSTTELDWLDGEKWAACADPGRGIPDGAAVVLAFDGSYNADSTALVAVTVEDKPHVEVVDVWEKPVDRPAWTAPRLEIMATVRAAFARWKVAELAPDPHIWVTEMETLSVEDGYPVVKFEQFGVMMLDATQRCYEMVNAGELTHGDHPDLNRHVANATLRRDKRGSGRLEKKSPERKIDLAVAMVMGVHRACVLAGQRPQAPEVWDLNEVVARMRAAQQEAGTAAEPEEPPPPTSGVRFIPL